MSDTIVRSPSDPLKAVPALGPVQLSPEQAARVRMFTEGQEASERSSREDNIRFGGDNCWYCRELREHRSPTR